MNTLVFTNQEEEFILSVTTQYTKLYKDSLALQGQIHDAERECQRLASEMENLKSSESHFYYDTSSKYNVDVESVQMAAANYVLNAKK